MAGEGAVLVAEDGSVYDTPAPKGELKNGVGAGDSMVAGFMAGWMEKHEYRHAFHMGVASGSASAFSENLATKGDCRSISTGCKGGAVVFKQIGGTAFGFMASGFFFKRRY